jgi:hypothetical protein
MRYFAPREMRIYNWASGEITASSSRHLTVRRKKMGRRWKEDGKKMERRWKEDGKKMERR